MALTNAKVECVNLPSLTPALTISLKRSSMAWSV